MASLKQGAEVSKGSELPRPLSDRIPPVYVAGLAASIALWLLAVRTPLWLDETVSFWQIHGGFSQIGSRQGLSFAAYSYILWFATKLFGTSEIALRIPSILAMLGALYLLYRAAWELFGREAALIAAILFSLHPIVAFAAIDARPYAFGALAINGAVFLLIRYRRDRSSVLAALFGVASSLVVYFHFLFTVLLPGLAGCFVLATGGDLRARLRQTGICLAAFAVAFLPVVPGLRYMFRTGGTHVFDEAPPIAELGQTLAPSPFFWVFLAVAILAAAARRIDWNSPLNRWTLGLCALTGLAPILILYDVSVLTPLHVFVARYRMSGMAGTALFWALLVSRINSRQLRGIFCAGCVLAGVYHQVTTPDAGKHGYTWKYALEFVNKNTSADGAPVLICSDLPEADHMPMPTGTAVKDSTLFAPLSYYPLNGTVVPLPRALTPEAIRLGTEFLRDAARKQQRFLAMAYWPSYPTLTWLTQQASGTHEFHILAQSDRIAVAEFVPRKQAGDRTGHVSNSVDVPSPTSRW